MISPISLKGVLPSPLRNRNQMIKSSISSKKPSENLSTLDQTIEFLISKVKLLEAEIEGLKHPHLMYKRPGASEHEKVTDFLDDIENRLQVLEE